VNVWLPTVIEPVKAVVFVFSATVQLKVPLPVPLLPDAIVMNGSLLTAVHEQSVPPAFTVTFLAPPLAGSVAAQH